MQLILTVIDYDGTSSSEPIGKVTICCSSSGTELRHWVAMLTYPRRPIAQWHKLKEPEDADDENKDDNKFDRLISQLDTKKVKGFLKGF